MGAATPRRGGFIMPGGDGPGVKPPKEGDKGLGVSPPKTPSKPEYTPQGNTFSTRTGLFGGLLEAIKKTDKFKNKVKEGGKGIGAPDKVKAEKFDKLLGNLRDSAVGGSKPKFSDVTAFSMGKGKPTPPMSGDVPDDIPPLEERLDYYEKNKDNNIVDNPLNTPGYGSRVDNPFGIYTADFKDRDGDGVDDRDQRGPGQPKIKFGKEVKIDKQKREEDVIKKPLPGRRRKKAVLFGESSPSTGSKKPTKGSPKGGMKKAGFMDAETKNKFEEMLAYMESFQK
jgi:hypothetical protein